MVTLVATIAEALAFLIGPAPDLVVLDLLPDLEPEAFQHRLKQRHGTVPMLIVSGASEIRTVAGKLGVSFLPKPFDLDEFVTIVAELTKDGRVAGTRTCNT